MAAVLLGAGVMLVGVVVGYSLSNSIHTEEVARWTRDIDEIME